MGRQAHVHRQVHRWVSIGRSAGIQLERVCSLSIVKSAFYVVLRAFLLVATSQLRTWTHEEERAMGLAGCCWLAGTYVMGGPPGGHPVGVGQEKKELHIAPPR